LRKTLLLSFLWCISICLAAQTYTIESVPNPKEQNNTYVSDPTNILSAQAKTELNQMIAAIEDSSTIQIAVVMLPSIGNDNPKGFTSELFNYWGIGQADKDNGMLILTVMDQRRTEFEPGYGLEGVLPDITCYRIGKEKLVPYFKKGQYGKGMLAAVEAIEDIVLLPDNVEYVKSDVKPQRRTINRTPQNNFIRNNDSRSSQDDWFISLFPLWLYLFLNLLFHIGYIFMGFRIKNSKEEFYDRYKSLNRVHWYVPLFFFPLPYVFVFFIVKRYLKHLRTAPRYTKDEGKPLSLLSEAKEDFYLADGQITEEVIGSVDYDVWITDDKQELLILRYDRQFSKYKECKSCNYKTYFRSHSKTVSRATTSSTGLRKDYYQCKNCNYQHTKEVVLARKTESSGSSGGSFSSSGSSGGGSFGGGSSGGGGGGVSW